MRGLCCFWVIVFCCYQRKGPAPISRPACHLQSHLFTALTHQRLPPLTLPANLPAPLPNHRPGVGTRISQGATAPTNQCRRFFCVVKELANADSHPTPPRRCPCLTFIPSLLPAIRPLPVRASRRCFGLMPVYRSARHWPTFPTCCTWPSDWPRMPRKSAIQADMPGLRIICRR